MTRKHSVRRGLAHSALALMLGAWALAAQAQAEVKFIEPDKFTDMGDSQRDREGVMQDLETHLQSLASRHLPGKQLLISFTDVDLAGDLEPRGAGAQRLRVMRSITIPRLEFSYVLSEAGKELKSGKASLRDMNYQMGPNRYFDSESLRYEKKMLDDWVAKELLGRKSLPPVKRK